MLGAWTYKVSYNDGASFPHTGIVSSGSATPLPGVGQAITVSAAAGAALTDDIWESLAAQVNDLTGSANHASHGTAGNRPIIRATAFNGRPALDYGVGTTFGLNLPSISVGAHSVFMVLRGDANSGAAITFANDGGNISVFGNTNISSVVARAGVTSAKDVSAGWLRDGVRRTVARTYGGTHATHLVYVNGVDVVATTNTFSGNPGTTPTSGVVNIGSFANTVSHRGLIAGWVIANRAWTPAEVSFLHTYATLSRGFTL